MKPQPRVLYLLNFVSMWECFSYYGMRVLLVLFMVHVLQYQDSEAFGLYALYTTLIELGGIFGGIIADKYLGLKRSIVLGGLTIAFGHICLSIPGESVPFFLGLGAIIAGTTLFRTNVAALLGQFYEENDPRRDAGYTLYYTGINIGGFLASILCGFVGEMYGWHAGFSLAALGMLLGNLSLFLGWKLLEDKGEVIAPSKWVSGVGVLGLTVLTCVASIALYYYELITPFIPLIAVAGLYVIYNKISLLTSIQKKGVKRLIVYVGLLIVFFMGEEQLGTSLVLFAERHVDRQTLWGMIPAASLITFNPFTILLLGPLLSRFMSKFKWDGLYKVAASFVFLGSAFVLLYAGSFAADGEGMIPLAYAIASIMMIALGEIFIGPTVYALAAEVAPTSYQGFMMGIVTMGFALANLCSGFLSQTMAIVDEASSLDTYTNVFKIIGCTTLILACVIIYVNKKRKVAIV